MISGHKRPIVCLPTGAGKTAVFAWMAQQTAKKNKHVWFLVHRRELLRQTLETFDKFDISLDAISVGMVKTVANRLDKLENPDLIVIDECHHGVASTYRKILDHHDQAYVIGLTATPCRLDGKPLRDIADDLIVGVSVKDLIAMGYLSPYRYFAPAVADLSKLKKKRGDYDTKEAASILMDKAVYGKVIETWKERAGTSASTVVYTTTVEHSKSVCEQFVNNGIKAEHFDAKTPDKERLDIIDRFKSGETTVLSNVDLISEGFDMPDIDCCIMLRPTASTSLFIQQAGRALRPREGKTAIILDHVGNHLRFGLPDDDREWSLDSSIKPRKQYGDDGMLTVRQCDNCFFTFFTGPTECPSCGHVIKKTREEIKNIENIRLEEIKQNRIERLQTETDCKTYSDYYQFAKKHGYRNPTGYAIGRCKANKKWYPQKKGR